MTKETHLSLEEVTALKEMFRAQTTELLDDYGRYVLELEGSSEPGDPLKAVQRVVHTVKGDSMSLEFDRLSELAHRLEDFLEPLKKANQRPARHQIDLLLACGDGMSTLLEDYCSEPPRQPMDIGPLQKRLNEAMPAQEAPRAKLYKITVSFQRKCEMHSAGAFMIRQRLEPLAAIHETTPDPESSTIEQSRTWTLIVETDADLDALKRAARVPGVSARVKAEPCDRPLPKVDGEDERNDLEIEPQTEDQTSIESKTPSTSTPVSSDQLRMEVGKIDRIMNLVGELVIGRSMVSQALSELSQTDEAAATRLNTANNFLERTLTELQAVVLKIRMVPVDHVFRRFPRVVRDLAHSGGKEVKLEVRGAKTELDKSIVDALHEPMLHLVRNAIDHGLEAPEFRVEAGKPSTGKLTLAAFYEGNHVHILIEDDGKGIDRDEVGERAVTLGLATRQEVESLPREEILNYLFQPGFSTRENVSTVSGRGIGMDVVRRAIETLKGTIDVSTEPGRGTRFLIRLPLTLAILKAILVESAGRTFAIPLSGVLEIVRLFAEEAATVLGKGVIQLRDRVVTLLNLKQALQIGDEAEDSSDRVFVILVGEAERRVGLVVDRILGEHELVVKPLEDPLVKSPGIAGASILGDGKVVLILNLRGLIEKKRRMGRRTEVPQ
jgi:two-component system chemotaxis sensor kinase CheA